MKKEGKMMTFETVIEIFKEQFEIDKDIEVAKFRRGYQIFIWDSKKEAYVANNLLLQTPEELFDELIKETIRYYEIKYRNTTTEKVDEKHKKKIDLIISSLKEKYNDKL